MITKPLAAWFATAAIVTGVGGLGVYKLAASTAASAPSLSNASTLSGGSSNAAQGATGNNGNGNGGEPPAKAFTIVGSLNGQLFPGLERRLSVSVDNPNNQAIRVYELQVSITTITKAFGRNGPCSASSVNLGTWTGGPYTLPANRPPTTVPGYIPITLKFTAENDCQGAIFGLAYTGKADKA